MATLIKIASATVGSGGASSIDFTSIPSTYTDLCLVLSIRGSGSYTATDCKVIINGSTTGYTSRALGGSGSAAFTFAETTAGYVAGYVPGTLATSNTFANNSLYFPNYAGSANKSWSVDSVTENNSSAAFMVLAASLWSNTSAITSLSYTALTGNFVQHSTATLYGINNS